MSISLEKSFLPVKLSQIVQKRSSLFFKRLVLFDEQAESQKSVRHYDYQCQGIQVLVDFFKKKQQIILEADKIRKKCQIQTDRQKHGKDTTRRIYLNSTFSPSEVSPIKQPDVNTQRGIRKDEQEQYDIMHSKAERNPNTMSDLLNLVKNVNRTNNNVNSTNYNVNRTYDGRHHKTQKTENDLNRQNSQYYGKPSKYSNSRYISQNYQIQSRCEDNINYYNYYKSRVLSTKHSRRQYIMDKIYKIESSLCNISNDEVRQRDISEQIIDEIRNLRLRLDIRGKRQYTKS